MKILKMQISLLFIVSTIFCSDGGVRQERFEQAVDQKQNKAACSIQVAWLRHQRNFWKAQVEDPQYQRLDLQMLTDSGQAKLHIEIGELQDEVNGLHALLAANAEQYQGLQEKLRLKTIQAQDTDDARIAQMLQKDVLYTQAIDQVSQVSRQKSNLQLELERLQGRFKQIEEELVRRNCAYDALVYRQRSTSCPFCMAALVLQVCEQPCCPGGLALIHHMWRPHSQTATALMGEPVRISGDRGSRGALTGRDQNVGSRQQ